MDLYNAQLKVVSRYLVLFVFLSFCLLTACYHALHITNEDEYFTPPSPPPREVIRLGVTSGNDAHVQNSRYVGAIVDALRRSGYTEKVLYPYNQSMHKDLVDVVVDINVNPRYSGRGSNFFVNWPGFLIWAPAIWGYGYIADIETSVNITRLKDGASEQITVPTKYEFRQAEIDRTWTEISWLEVSVIALIGGIAFTSYDPDVTNEFITKVTPSYGSYVAKKLEESLQAILIKAG